MRDDRAYWNERYRETDFESHLPDEPAPVLREAVDWLPDGRALDVATGTGRNARFLAEQGYSVDAVDVSDEALRIGRERAAERDLSVEWIQADLDSYCLRESTYDVVVVTFFQARERLPDLKAALAPGGVLCYEGHLRADPPADRGPSSDRHRFGSNELLRACLDLTVLRYEERTRVDADGRRSAVATLLARNSHGAAQDYPPAPPASG